MKVGRSRGGGQARRKEEATEHCVLKEGMDDFAKSRADWPSFSFRDIEEPQSWW